MAEKQSKIYVLEWDENFDMGDSGIKVTPYKNLDAALQHLEASTAAECSISSTDPTVEKEESRP